MARNRKPRKEPIVAYSDTPADNEIIVKDIRTNYKVTYSAGLNFRKEPNGDILDVIPFEGVLEVKEVKDGWAFGSYNNKE